MSRLAGHPFSRRTALRGGVAAAGALTLPTLAACSSGPKDAGGTTVTLGSNFSDALPKKALADAGTGFEKKSGKTLKINTIEHTTFQEQINQYLKGSPDDVFSWFAGYRMQFFAKQGLATDVSDVWKEIGGGYTDAFKKASTGEDGKQYFVPYYLYPWAVFYRPSVWKEKGYTVPKTWDEYRTLAAKMKTDGLTPIAFAAKEGWPAMGTFDYINMRLNGYDFHVSLMAGKESWEDKKVKAVFDNWASILPHTQAGALGLTWQEGAQALQKKQAGMHVLGLFVGNQFSDEERKDLDFFAFPELDPANGQKAVEAPIDGWMITKKAKNVAGAKELLKYFATPEAQGAYLGSDPNNVATHKGADTSTYTPLQKKAVELISGAQNISQFMDRDTRPDFATTVMIPSLQEFLKNPKDVDSICKNIESQKKNIFKD
ncbi:ABC transporter substrate-binding protein [Longispora fulva]|uniref:Multiple sugar transport system substrate-binding protein n=1 Tax=Longispora fulva TaxID=619741 RepID=A0A8J7GHU4_9ACTN|nr:ABC transporter substrate-binding protein [Longispora fulva]MBG6138296.1 multiple sugar transport system substrate-binding protein [Longispora fulva]GIG60547.1 ABC transporter substrate-binding protein [Longispora fulva]